MLTKMDIEACLDQVEELVEAYEYKPDAWRRVEARKEEFRKLIGLDINLGPIQLLSFCLHRVYGDWGATHAHRIIGSSRESIRMAENVTKRRVSAAMGYNWGSPPRYSQVHLETRWKNEDSPMLRWELPKYAPQD